ncbi:hypothetical protein, partial [Agathobaculum desmolans]|uniref:hypothetical protein n=1 Tax=Agathobaculum desmolans TaxID=39484 RepID=UPI00248F21DF
CSQMGGKFLISILFNASNIQYFKRFSVYIREFCNNCNERFETVMTYAAQPRSQRRFCQCICRTADYVLRSSAAVEV